MDDDKVIEIIDDLQDALNKTQRRIAHVSRGLRSIGSGRGDIYRSAKSAGISPQRIAAAEQGINLRWVPARAWLGNVWQNMNRTAEDDPMNRINLIRVHVSKKPPTYGVVE